MSKVAIVTGASSGVGRATAVSLAKLGWNVLIIARRKSGLDETVALAGESGKQIVQFAADIADADAVDQAVDEALQKWGRVDALVNAAGTNIPDRSLAVMTPERYKEVFDTNLSGALYAIQAVLPVMRKQKEGTIVNINSIAGQNASVLSGAAYVMSKFALSGLTQSINVEEGQHNIRATSIFPGDINTGILEKRPSPPPMEARGKMLQAQDVADCVLLAINLPARAVVEELRITPR